MIRLLVLAVALAASTTYAAPNGSAWCGTSLAYGYSHNATPPAERLATLLGHPVANCGVGSDRLASIVTRWQTYFKPFLYRRLIAEGGTNDLHLDSANGTTLWGTFRDWADDARARRSDGGGEVQIVIITIPPRWGSAGWTADMETQRLAFNTLALAYAAANPSVRIVNSDTCLGTGSPVELQAALRNADLVHFSAAGMQALAQCVRDVL